MDAKSVWVRGIAIAILSVSLVCLDYVSGPLLQTPLLYVVPIGLAAWFLNERWGVLLALSLSLARAYLAYAFWRDTVPIGLILVNLGLRSFVYILLAELVTRHARLHRLQKNRLDLILQYLPVGVGFCDAEGKIVGANPAEKAIWGGFKFVDGLGYGQFRGWFPGSDRALQSGDWAVARTLRTGKPVLNEIVEIETFDGVRKTILNSSVRVEDEIGRPLGAIFVNQDISEEIKKQRENLALIRDLEDAMANIKVLKGLLPICASCKRIRDDKGYWNRIEDYLHTHSDVIFSHGICPECAARIYPEIAP